MTPLTKTHKHVIGYYGAIADWFDTELLEYLATKLPDCQFVLIGHTFGSDIRKLSQFSNVEFLGERPYSELPKYLHLFDVCIIPFKLSPLIKATHPVKIYEYFSSGKPVVSTYLPELIPMADLCYLATDHEDFLKKLNIALNENNPDVIKKRINFASENTWQHRFKVIYDEIQKFEDMAN